MLTKIKIPEKIINNINKDIYYVLTGLFKNKINNHEKIFNFLKKNKKFRPQVFDLLNMLPILGYVNYEIQKKLKEKILNSFLVNWTYPQIRLDYSHSSKFLAPAHLDKWILDKEKKGYIVWIPLNKPGSPILVSETNRVSQVVKNIYWNLEAKTNGKFKKEFVKFGEGLIFDESLLHKSADSEESRITLQLRFEEIKYNKFERSVTQKINEKTLAYWKKKFDL